MYTSASTSVSQRVATPVASLFSSHCAICSLLLDMLRIAAGHISLPLAEACLGLGHHDTDESSVDILGHVHAVAAHEYPCIPLRIRWLSSAASSVKRCCT